jgi:hypothetical protein
LFSGSLILTLVNEYPRGYPRFAAWASSDPNFRVFRRFNTLRVRLILLKQQEIARLEAQLDELDEIDNNSNHGYGITSIHDDAHEQESQHSVLLKLINEKLEQYGKHLFSDAQLFRG